MTSMLFYRGPRLALASLTRVARLSNFYDVAIATMLLGVSMAIVHVAHAARAPLDVLLTNQVVSLNPQHLPEYALRSTLRMFAAMAASLLFTFLVATLAAKNARAEKIIIPALDILQSVPVLGFISFTVTFFLGLFPGRQIGAECAAIFAIFTSQAWNMAFSFYQSLRTVPRDYQEVAEGFCFSPWLRFWRLEAPFAMPGLIWNMMMSMSGGWFFVVACEAITVGNTTVTLPGIGAYLNTAINQRNFTAVAWAVIAMALLIVIYDQLFFRPIIAWADKFRVEQTASTAIPRSWLYNVLCRTQLFKRLVTPLARLSARLLLIGGQRQRSVAATAAIASPQQDTKTWYDWAWRCLIIVTAAFAARVFFKDAYSALSISDVKATFNSGLVTCLRVVFLIAIASCIWVPVGIWIGLRPALAQRIQPLAQFLAAFPANVLFPFAVVLILSTHADPNIWLSPLMILGTQWYILFNVIAGASAFPTDLRDVAHVNRMQGTWTWWRRVMLPGIFPYYLTGALTASGGSWNASIVAEWVEWGDQHIHAYGLGAYIAKATAEGDHARVVLGVAMMAFFVTFFNRVVWRRLYRYAQNHWQAN